MASYLLAIDQGTTSTRVIVFDADLRIKASAQEEFTQHFPASGWVEHEAEDLWATTVRTLRAAVLEAGIAVRDIAGIGITNQRETTILWDRATGTPIHKAIVWQDRRTAETCAALRAEGLEPVISAKTGLLLDPYFSGTKIGWLLDHIPGARARAEAGELAFGTVDSFLLWRLTGGKVHATDATNASRTLLLNIHTGAWDEELCRIFRVPMTLLPEVKDCAAEFGETTADLLGIPVPVRGVAGDQQAATVGQACFLPGMAKATYGTGCFALLNIGHTPVLSQNRLLTTIAYQLNGRRAYALEGAIFIAGAAVQWLRDGLGVLSSAGESGRMAAEADLEQQLYLVPAFTGLGAPYWDAEARGAIFGLTRASGPKEFARAALESVGYQTRELIEAMHADWLRLGDSHKETVLRVDGGMTVSDWTMQFLADMLHAPVDRPVVKETTALGAAYLAGLQAGVLAHPEEFAASWSLERRFTPHMASEIRARKYAGWKDAVRRTVIAH